MTVLQSNGVEIRIQADPAVKIHVGSATQAIDKAFAGGNAKPTTTAPAPTAEWVTEVESAGFVQLDNVLHTEKEAGITVSPIQLDLRMTMAGIAPDDEETEVLFLVFAENLEGKILSVRTSDSKSLMRNVLESGDVEFKSLIEHPLFDFPKTIFRVFWKTTKKITGVREDISHWDDNLRKMLYDATDHVFFKPEDDIGFSLKYFNSNGATEKLDATKRNMMGEGCSLLLIHGIFSQVRTAFKGLTTIPQNSIGSSTLLQTLHNHYHGRIFGYDHATFSKNSLENASELLDTLPEDVELDLICHSRGGQVVRCLLEHPDTIKKREAKNIQFKKVLFVAGACQGSPLAGDKFLNNFLLVCTALRLIPSLKILAKLLETLAGFAHNAPGVSCLDPNSACIQKLDENIAHNNAQELTFCRANFDPGGSLTEEILDEIVIDLAAFNGGANDWIVPFAGANISQKYSGQAIPKIGDGIDFGDSQTVQTSVYHLNYFYQRELQEKILSFFS